MNQSWGLTLFINTIQKALNVTVKVIEPKLNRNYPTTSERHLSHLNWEMTRCRTYKERLLPLSLSQIGTKAKCSWTMWFSTVIMGKPQRSLTGCDQPTLIIPGSHISIWNRVNLYKISHSIFIWQLKEPVISNYGNIPWPLLWNSMHGNSPRGSWWTESL